MKTFLTLVPDPRLRSNLTLPLSTMSSRRSLVLDVVMNSRPLLRAVRKRSEMSSACGLKKDDCQLFLTHI